MKQLYFKPKTIVAVFFVTLSLTLPAQSPQLVSYQAIVRDVSNNPIVDTEVSIIITVNQGSASGTQVYSETHSVTTNAFGLINVFLGNGSTTDDFSAIDWSNSPYYLNINIDGKDMDPVQFVSVPYAIYADQAGNVFSGNYNDLTNKPALNISNWNTAYSWGDHATQGYYDSKWDQSGNIVNVAEDIQVGIGTSEVEKQMLTVVANRELALTDPVFRVINNEGVPVFTIFNDGSIDVKVLDDQGKGPKGGFAIGGFDLNKAPTQPYLSISPDSMRLYFNETIEKGPKGGFAIGGFDRSKGINDKYVEIRGSRGEGLAGNNIFLGFMAGGEEGYESANNIAIGTFAGMNLVPGTDNNIFIGNATGDLVRGSNNIFIGNGAGTKIESADYRLLIDAVPQEDPNLSYISGLMDDKGTRTLRLNAQTGINKEADPLYDLDVAGIVRAENISTKSDIRLKSDIHTISNPLNKVLSLRGVSFNWKRDGMPSDDMSMGLIAQEAEEIIPELVTKGTDYYSINYAPITALLVEAIKELKKENDVLRGELIKVEDLERQIQELRAIISK